MYATTQRGKLPTSSTHKAAYSGNASVRRARWLFTLCLAPSLSSLPASPLCPSAQVPGLYFMAMHVRDEALAYAAAVTVESTGSVAKYSVPATDDTA